jgi:hypothetical protein
MTNPLTASSRVSSAERSGTNTQVAPRLIAQRWALLSSVVVGFVSLAAGLRLARFAFDSYDALIMFVVAKSIATTHTTLVPAASDPLQLMTPHSTYGLGMSGAESVAYLVAVRTGHDPVVFAMFVNPVLFACVGLIIWAWARAAFATEIQAAAVALVTSFGTLLAYTSTGFSEIGTALGVAFAILGVELAGRRPQLGGLLAGIGAAVAVVWRPDSALLIALPVAVALFLRTRRGFPIFLLPVVPAGVLNLVYNWSNGAQYGHFSALQLFTHPLLSGALGLLVSPGRGLLLYVPVVVLALVAVPWAWRRSPVVTGLCLVLLLIRIPFYAKVFAWMGGWAWGPRYLMPAMPCLAPLLYEIVRRLSWRHWPLAAAASLVIAVSISIQVLGASVRYDTDTANQTMTAVWRANPNSEPSPQDAVMFDWRYFPILEHLRELHHGRNLAPGYRGGVGLPYN